MDRTSKLLLVLVTISLIQDIQCGLYGDLIRQYFRNIYATPYESRAISRRNIPTLTGSGVFQEPSSRDLDVGFAVGVKDQGEASDILINNHSAKTYSPPGVEQPPSSASMIQEPSGTAKELNIGVYVDPKSGVRYFTPGQVPITGSPNINTLPERYPSMPIISGLGQTHPIATSTQQLPYQSFSPYPYLPIPEYINRFPVPPPVTNELPYPYHISPSISSFPQSAYRSPAPLQNYIVNPLNEYPNFNHYDESYPYKYYKQPSDVDEFSGEPYISKLLHYLPTDVKEPLFRPPFTTNVYDDGVYPENYQGRFPRSHRRFPFKNPDIRYKWPLRNMNNVFQIQEQAPREQYGRFTQPVLIRQEPQTPEIIADQQGMPVMTAQPYGERQVGAFKLKNDHGYQVTMNVPPIPADGPADGVLVMEMKANLYRPLS